MKNKKFKVIIHEIFKQREMNIDEKQIGMVDSG